MKRWHILQAITAVRLAGTALGLVGIGIGVWAYRIAHPGTFDLEVLAQDYGASISTTLIGFTLTVLVIDALNEHRANRERKRAIIQQIGSSVNDAALEAARLATIEGWDRDGSLRHADLVQANLQRAILRMFSLQEAILLAANLQEADLNEANLQGAELSEANMQGAQLIAANLQEAILIGAKLQGAHLLEANMQDAILDFATFDEDTTLPNGSKWTPITDMSLFTDPKHPNFWRSHRDILLSDYDDKRSG